MPQFLIKQKRWFTLSLKITTLTICLCVFVHQIFPVECLHSRWWLPVVFSSRECLFGRNDSKPSLQSNRPWFLQHPFPHVCWLLFKAWRFAFLTLKTNICLFGLLNFAVSWLICFPFLKRWLFFTLVWRILYDCFMRTDVSVVIAIMRKKFCSQNVFLRRLERLSFPSLYWNTHQLHNDISSWKRNRLHLQLQDEDRDIPCLVLSMAVWELRSLFFVKAYSCNQCVESVDWETESVFAFCKKGLRWWSFARSRWVNLDK